MIFLSNLKIILLVLIITSTVIFTSKDLKKNVDQSDDDDVEDEDEPAVMLLNADGETNVNKQSPGKSFYKKTNKFWDL